MGLWFQNGYTDPVYIALLWYDPGCSPEPLAKERLVRGGAEFVG